MFYRDDTQGLCRTGCKANFSIWVTSVTYAGGSICFIVARITATNSVASAVNVLLDSVETTSISLSSMFFRLSMLQYTHEIEHKYNKQVLKKSMEYATQNENRRFYSSQVISEVEREDNSLSLFYSDFVHDENNY